jgi:hypothetical protein
MSRTTLSFAIRATPALVLALTLAACGGSGTTSAGATSSPSASSAPSDSSVPSATAAATPSVVTPAVDQSIRLTYADGKVSGDTGRVKVELGSTVALVVTSEVADEVHLHGFDKHVDVPKGGTATLVFTADREGIYVAELEHLKVPLVQLQVQ